MPGHLTSFAVIIHQYDFFQQPGWCLIYDAADGPFDDRQSFIQVDQHNTDGGQVLWVILLCTPVFKLEFLYNQDNIRQMSDIHVSEVSI